MEICRKVTGCEVLNSFYIIHTDSADIKIYFMTDEIIRFRVSFDKEFAEESYMLSLTAWEDRLDSLFTDSERKRITPIKPGLEDSDSKLTFTTAALRLEVDKDPLCVRLYDSDGTELYSSLAGSPFTLDSNRRITHYSRMNEDDCFYGFGEKAGVLNKNQAFLRQRATDAMG